MSNCSSSTTLVRDLDMVALDFETTGQGARRGNLPWQLGAVAIQKGELLGENGLSILLNVPFDHPFNPYTPGRWASIREELDAAPTLLELWPSLAPWLTGHCLLAHNAPTERTILQRFFPLHQFGPWLDSLKVARAAYPSLPSFALSDILDYLELTSEVQSLCPERQPHDALFDATGSAVLLKHVLSLPAWHNITLTDMLAL